MEHNGFNKINHVLLQNGIKQNWLAEQLGISTNTLSSYCRNISQPRLDTLNKIAELLNVQLIDLINI